MTVISKTDPRTKLLIVACITGSAVIMNDLLFLAILFVAACIISALSHVNPMLSFYRLKALVGMVIFIALMQSIFNKSGEALISIGMVQIITSGGLNIAAQFVLRMLTIIISAGVLTSAKSREIIQGLVQLKIPYEIAFMSFIGIRFLPVFKEEMTDALTAIQLRGINIRSLPLKQKLEVYAGLFQPIVAGSLLKAKSLSLSIEMRGFKIGSGRTSHFTLKLTWKDYVIMIIMGLLTALLMVLYYKV